MQQRGQDGKILIMPLPCKLLSPGSRPPTESSLDVSESNLLSQVRAARNTIMFADGNRAWRRAATQANLEFYQVKHCLLEFSRVVTAQNGQTIKAGTQCLDGSWSHMKRFIPNSITTKDAATALLNGDIWDYVYQWQWRFNNRDRLWETVPQILAEIANHS